MAAIDGIDENVWAMMFINSLLKELENVEAVRTRIMNMRDKFTSLEVNITGTKLEGKITSFNNLIDKFSDILDGTEMDWLKENTHKSVNTEKLNSL